MQSKAATVDAYIAEAEAGRRPALERMRALGRARFPDYDEEMRWGMAAYTRGEAYAVAFANQKQYLALYVGKAALDANARALGKLDCGKGCVRFRDTSAIDFQLVENLLASCARDAAAC